MKNYYSTLNILTEIMFAKCRDLVLVEVKAMPIIAACLLFLLAHLARRAIVSYCHTNASGGRVASFVKN